MDQDSEYTVRVFLGPVSLNLCHFNVTQEGKVLDFSGFIFSSVYLNRTTVPVEVSAFSTHEWHVDKSVRLRKEHPVH